MGDYGQLVSFSTGSAPHLCSGVCLNFREEDAFQRQIHEGEDGAILAAILHSQTKRLSFGVKFTDGSTDFPDLSAGAALAVTGYSTSGNTGLVLASDAEEYWQIAQAKTGSIEATYFPDLTPNAGAVAAGTLTAFTPAAQALGGLHPAAKIIWSTKGITQAAGVVHGIRLRQHLDLLPDDPAPDGKILGCRTANYMRTLSVEILALTSGTAPVNGAVLTLTNAPAHAASHRLENVAFAREIRGRKMYTANAFWFNGID